MPIYTRIQNKKIQPSSVKAAGGRWCEGGWQHTVGGWRLQVVAGR